MHKSSLDAYERSSRRDSTNESDHLRINAHAEHVAADVDHKDLLAIRFVVSDELALESQDETHVTVVNKASAARLKLSRALYRFLLGFDTPRRIEHVVGVEPPSRLLSQVCMLVDKRMLVDADAPASDDAFRLRTAVAYKFCSSPGYVRSTAVSDFVVLGVPYDLGGEVDCRLAPAAIRQKSLDYTYQVQFDTGRSQGWFDVNRGVRILEGASIVDAGDVYVDYGENQCVLFARIDRAIEDACTTETVPVILGGDRSVTYAAVNCLRRRQPLTVVQFAMEPAIRGGEGERAVTASGLGRSLLQMNGVELFVSLGNSDEASDREQCSERLIVKSASSLRQQYPEDIARLLGVDLAVHLSIDLSVVTAEYARSDATGAPRGLTLHEIKGLIRALGTAHRIVSIDIVGLDMERESFAISAVSACHLVLVAMSAAYDRF